MKTMMLRFQFDRESDAKLAMDSLQELDYRPSSYSIKQNTVDLHVDQESSTPSLEIMLAHGGDLLEDKHSPSTGDMFSMAYQLESYLGTDNNVTENDENVDGDYERPDLEGNFDHVYHETSDATDTSPLP